MLIIKHLKDYLYNKYGHSDIFKIDCSDEEYVKYIGWVEAIEEYETKKQTKAVLDAIAKVL